MKNTLNKITSEYYKASVAVIFGIFSYLLNIHPLIIHLGPHNIPAYTGLCLPVYIAIVWGWKYGLLSAFAGGYLPILFFWEPEGYGTLFFFSTYLLWVIWHGFWRDFSKDSGETFWTNPLILEVVFRFFIIISALTIYPFLLSRNPPFWNSSGRIVSLSSGYILHRTLLQTLLTLYSIMLLKLALTNPYVRAFFRLKNDHAEEKTRYYFPVFIFTVLILWFLMAFFRYFTLYSETVTFSSVLLYQLYNNFFLQDVLILYIITATFLYLSTHVQKTHFQTGAFRREFEHKLREAVDRNRLLDQVLDLLRQLPELKEALHQIRFLSQSLPTLPGLKDCWIFRTGASTDAIEFFTPSDPVNQKEIIRYLKSNEGQIRIKKLKKSGVVSVDPAVIVNQPGLFPDIYHVLISAYIDIPEGPFLFGFIVEEDLEVTRLFTSILTIITDILQITCSMLSRQAQSPAIKSQELYRILQITYSRLHGYWLIINHAGQIKTISEDFLHFSGYSRADLNGLDCKRIVNYVDQDFKKLNPETPSEAYLIQKNGSRTPVMISRTSLSSRSSSDHLIHILDNLAGHLKLKALEDREFRYRSYFNNMSDPSFVIDRTTRIIDVNQMACTVFKYSRNEMIGLTVADIVSEEEIPKIDHHMQNILKHQVSRFESTHVTKNGHRIVSEIHARRYSERKQELIHVVLRNIGKRKEQEEALQRFYQTVLTVGAKGRAVLVGFTEQGVIRYANPLASKFTGLTESELKEKRYYEHFIAPDHQREAEEYLDSLRENEKEYGRKILPLLTHNGEEKMIIWDYSHIQREWRYNLFFAIGTDITDLYKEYDFIRRERDDYRTYIDRAPIPFCILNRQGNILHFNTAMGEMLRTSYHELRLQNLGVFMDRRLYVEILSWIEDHSPWQSARKTAHIKRADGTPVKSTLFLSILNEDEILMVMIEDIPQNQNVFSSD